jgi:hypothetical protein
MGDFNSFLDWKLLAGSHSFPGSDGGTCINEAAIVAAGFGYRQVTSVDDCPACFSRPLAAYALALNDGIVDDALRQRLLMPFVTRLAGSADAPGVEEARVQRILIRIVTKLLPPTVESYGCEEAALACRSAADLGEAADALSGAHDAVGAASCPHPGLADHRARRKEYLEGISNLILAFVDYERRVRLPEVAIRAATAAIAAVSWQSWGLVADGERRAGLALAACFLEEALKLGNCAAPIETNLVVARFEDARRQAAEGECAAA